MTITILTDKLNKNKTAPCFYYGNEIGIVSYNNRIYSIESRGSLEVILNDTKYKNHMAKKELISLGYDNKKFAGLGDDLIFNNWFALFEIDEEGTIISDDIELIHDYNECIEVLNNIKDYVD